MMPLHRPYIIECLAAALSSYSPVRNCDKFNQKESSHLPDRANNKSYSMLKNGADDKWFSPRVCHSSLCPNETL